MNRITLTCDTIVDANGFALTIADGRYVMSGNEALAAARTHRERLIETATEEIIALKRQLHDQEVIARFWRQAAEHACVGWNALEDEHELLKETLRALTHDEAP